MNPSDGRHRVTAFVPLDRRRFLGRGAVAVACLALSACSGGSGQDTAEQPSKVDVGFATDMALHHEQALAMCQRVLGRDTGGAVQAAASEILQNQSYERGLMHAWLQSWGESTAPPTEVMGWMGMARPAEEMVGLASKAEMAELAELGGVAKGRRFLQLMRAHHVGGTQMADAASDARTAPVRRLAAQMSATQTYEIEVFDQLLATTYAS